MNIKGALTFRTLSSPTCLENVIRDDVEIIAFVLKRVNQDGRGEGGGQ